MDRMNIELRPMCRGRQTLFHFFTASDRSSTDLKAKVVPRSGNLAPLVRNPLCAGILRKKVRKSQNVPEPRGL
jgi:hypothetical protein